MLSNHPMRLALLTALLTACGGNDGGARHVITPGSDMDASTSDGGDGGPSDDPTTDFEIWMQSVDKLRDCGIVGDGVYTFDPTVALKCDSRCAIAASCGDLTNLACNDQSVSSIETCLSKCNNNVVACGDGTTVMVNQVCDKVVDCKTGEDEKHCDTFQCTSGQSIQNSVRCNGADDCADGSDEQGCALVCGKPVGSIFGGNAGDRDAGVDAGSDAGAGEIDSGTDTTHLDAGMAEQDAGVDAGKDAGPDASDASSEDAAKANASKIDAGA